MMSRVDIVFQDESFQGKSASLSPEGSPYESFTRTIILATMVLWAAHYAILTFRSMLNGAEPFWVLAGIRFLMLFAGCGLCWMLHLSLYPHLERGFWPQFRLVALLAPLAAGAFPVINELILQVAGIDPGFQLTGVLILTNVSFSLWFFMTWATMYLAVSSNARLIIEQRRRADARDQAQAARLQALRYQVNPHFLFNALNSISALIMDNRNFDADRVVNRLASFFRASLATEPTQFITLAEEVALQRAYLEIEEVRYADIDVVESIAPEIADISVPPLILQPLVENAVKHGVPKTGERLRISIEARRSPEGAILTISDNGTGSRATAGTGTGLGNVRERLLAAYGQSASFEAKHMPGEGFSVLLTIPA
jgi:hypothetical protein